MDLPPSTRKAVHADIPRLIETRHAVRENRLSDPHSGTAADRAVCIDRPAFWLWIEDGGTQGFAAGDPRDGLNGHWSSIRLTRAAA